MNSQEKVYTSLGLYVHVPFCVSPCDYCAFYKEIPSKVMLQQYVHAICQEIAQIEDERAFDTVYFGGGTPGILSPTYIDRIAEAIHQKSHRQPVEWTVEIAPNSIHPTKLLHWKSAGANRISMGIQSFSPQTLKTLGRRQTIREIENAYQWARSANFTNIGIDLIFGAPGQTIRQWQEDLQCAIHLQPEHISTYCLTYEENTYLKNIFGDAADANRDGDFYEFTCKFLPNHGFPQYEISNFSKPGYESIHNIHTWEMQEWIGVGPSASSQYRGIRKTNVPDVTRWAQGIISGKPALIETTRVTENMLTVDKIIFGLRITHGTDIPKTYYTQELMPYFHELEEDGLMSINSNFSDKIHIRLTHRGILLCDAISREIFNRIG